MSMKTLTRQLRCSCGHNEQEELTLDTDTAEGFENLINFFETHHKFGYCKDCQKLYADHKVTRVLKTGDMDTSTIHYTLKSPSIRNAVRFCNVAGINYRSQEHKITSAWDCTGQLFSTTVKFKKFRNHITIRITNQYDF